MNNLNHYIKEAQGECFKRHGVIFAFSQEQFEEQKQPDTQYANLGNGLILPYANILAFKADHSEIVSDGIEKDIAENGAESIIFRELQNHECFYTGDLEPCIEALDLYGFSEHQIFEVYNHKIAEV